jgi:hypothetical protein
MQTNTQTSNVFFIGIPSKYKWGLWELIADVLGAVGRTPSGKDISRGWWYLAVAAFFGPACYFFLI